MAMWDAPQSPKCANSHPLQQHQLAHRAWVARLDAQKEAVELRPGSRWTPYTWRSRVYSVSGSGVPSQTWRDQVAWLRLQSK
jgi:hypothetical protein